MKVLLLSLLALAALALFVYANTLGNLRGEYQRQLNAEMAKDKESRKPIITEADISKLPRPVQRFLQKNGTVGRPRVAGVLVNYDMEMFQKPGSVGMPGPAQQYDGFDPPRRLFFLTTVMKGLPVAVLHDYRGKEATMRVRLSSLLDVINIASSSDFARTETVTLLNDLCFFAPSWLTDDRLQWHPVDDHSAAVTFTNGPYNVGATLIFNDSDELVNFVSDDRGALQDDGSLKIMRWSTPMRNYQESDGRWFPTEGEAIWHYPEGEFSYGKMKHAIVKSLE
jgi:hypothetical protein